MFYKVFIVTDTKNASQWRLVFGIGSAMQIFAAILFLFWGSGEEQPWARSKIEIEQEKSNRPRLELTEQQREND